MIYSRLVLLWYISSAVHCERREPPVRRGPGSTGAHLHGLLADGVGAEDADRAHAHQRSGSYWIHVTIATVVPCY